jgi:VCBS repeat-containing protein
VKTLIYNDFILIKKGEYQYEVDTSETSLNYLINKKSITAIKYTDRFIIFNLIGETSIKLAIKQEQSLNIFSQLNMPELLI